MGMADDTQDLWETCTLLEQQLETRPLSDPVVFQMALGGRI